MLHFSSVSLAGYPSFKVQAFRNKDGIVLLGICLRNPKPRQGRVKWGSPTVGTAVCVCVCVLGLSTCVAAGGMQGTTQWIIFKLQMHSHINHKKCPSAMPVSFKEIFFTLFLDGIPGLRRGF